MYPEEKYMPRVQKKPSVNICNLDICESNNEKKEFFKSLDMNYCEDVISLLMPILPLKYRGKTCTLDTGYKLLKWSASESLNIGTLSVQKNSETMDVSVYQKKIPLIDPFQWLKYKETSVLPFDWNKQNKEVLDPENQAYIDTLGSSLVSKLSTLYNSPHFCKFYGCFRAVENVYKYDLSDDLEDIRFTNWFWSAIDEKEFVLNMVEKSSGRALTLDEIKELMKPDDEYLEDSDSESGSDSQESRDSDTSESNSSMETPNTVHDLEEVSLDDKSVDSDTIILKKKTSNHSSINSDYSNDSVYDDYDIYVEIQNMPVVVMYIEKCQGTLDELIDNENAPADTFEKEVLWCAWLFQIIAALCQLQGDLRLTHNDLHTNNVLWKTTTEEFLYYKDSLGRSWKVPTYGRIFTIIDYGRAIFSINNFFCISSDYQDGNNAAGQYNFGPLEDFDEPKVLPNKNFDLSRLACSLVRGLYPYNPAAKEGGAIITKEKGWIVRETNHPLFNLLWTWLKSKNGENILEKEDGREKFPGFDLYIEIAHNVNDALPRLQFAHPAMKQFLVPTLPLGANTIKIPL